MLKPDLVAEADSRGIDSGGTVEEITARLVAADEANPDQAEVVAEDEEPEYYQKVMAVGVPYETANWDASDHSANAAYVVTEAVNAGFRPCGEVTFDNAEPNPQAPLTSTYLTYSVPVTVGVAKTAS
jgi:hypothetical protein